MRAFFVKLSYPILRHLVPNESVFTAPGTGLCDGFLAPDAVVTTGVGADVMERQDELQAVTFDSMAYPMSAA
jgi:hypothetical protein